MYKTKLQELCHQRLWNLPSYSSTRDGPDHKPRFQASLLVNGVSFNSPHFCKSSKEAQNEAARIAFQYFTTSPPIPSLNHVSSSSSISSSSSSTGSSTSSTVFSNSSNGEGTLLGKNQHVSNNSLILRKASGVKDDEKFGGSSSANTVGEGTMLVKNQEVSKNSAILGNALGVKDNQEFGDMRYLYKTQLQNYAQRRSLSLPVYSCVREGSPHAPLFKAKVTVDGQTFESSEFCHTLKEAEYAAAKAALSSLPKDGIQEDDCGLYKNLLQDLTQKEGFSIPIYKTTTSGASHVPIFTSTVEVEGDVFRGVASKTKKQAEMSAAKVAYSKLKERQLSRISASLPQSGDAQEALECNYSTLQSILTVDLQQNLEPGNILHSNPSIRSEENRYQVADLAEKFADSMKVGGDHSKTSPPKPGTGSAPRYESSPSSDLIYERLRDPFPSIPSPEDEPSSPTTASECSDRSVTKQNTDLPATACTLLCNRVRVYPCKPNLKFSKDITLLPISDDKWVAVSLDFPNERGIEIEG